jgi:hypothetical protein
MSMVPNNANTLLQNDIAQAKADGGNFESASVPSPSITDLVNLVITDTFAHHRHVTISTNERGGHYLGVNWHWHWPWP